MVSIEVPFPFALLPSLEECSVDAVDIGPVREVNEPNGSELSKLFSGTAANGSNILVVASDFEALLSGCGAGSGAAKKSYAAETAGKGAGWGVNRSTLPCTNRKNVEN